MTWRERLQLQNPIRVAGFLAIFFLAGPGTFAGVCMLLAHAGVGIPFQLPRPATHAQLQLIGFFLFHIWGFLVHGLSGMLGANVKKTARVTPWMWATAASLLALFTADIIGPGSAVMMPAGALLLASVTMGSAILVWAGIRGSHPWLEAPFPLLIIPLATPPLAVLLWLIPNSALNAAASQLMLWGCIIPIIHAMGYRMFSAMVRMQAPNERIFSWASALWGMGVVSLVAATAGLPVPSALGWGVLALAAVLFVFALGIYHPLRKPAGNPRFIAVDASLLLHIRIAFGFLLLSLAIFLLMPTGQLPGSEFYWNDAGRHFASIGFAFILVAGITQRVLPSFLRANPSSARWMNGTLAALTVGVALRATEPFMPGAAPWVRLSAVLLYGGILGYSLQVFIALCKQRVAGPAKTASESSARKDASPRSGSDTRSEPAR